jgi:hypothetical protein
MNGGETKKENEGGEKAPGQGRRYINFLPEIKF